LPWWCLHKDLFSFQIIDTKIVFENNDSNLYKIEEDEKFFLVEGPSMWLSNFFAYWLYFLPLCLCLKYTFIWPKHYIIIKHELHFYFYGFLGRFSIFNELFNVLPSPYWADVYGERKKAGGHSAERLKYKRRYRDRLGYFLDVTGWGKFCLWKARLNKKYYFINGFYTIYMYLRNIFLYFLIILVYLIIYYLIYNKKLYTSNKYKVWRYKILKDFWKVKLYVSNINIIKLNYLKKKKLWSK
jgi:hypothetical protein